jgi:hypothetical protein
MADRLEELQLRRRQLLLRSERLRAELAVDQQVMLDALSGVDRVVATARKLAPPFLLIAGGALLFKFLRRSPRAARAASAEGAAYAARGARGAGFAARALFWVSLARRVMPYLPVVKALWRSRFSQRARPEDWAGSAQ